MLGELMCMGAVSSVLHSLCAELRHGYFQSVSLLRYGEEWKRQRQFVHIALSPEAVKKYESVRDFVVKHVDTLFGDPDNFDRQRRL